MERIEAINQLLNDKKIDKLHIEYWEQNEEDELYLIRNHLNYNPAEGSGFCVLIRYCPECGRELIR